MKVLVVLGKDSKKRYLIKIDARTLIDDIKYLLKENRLNIAIMMALAGGTVEEEITCDDESYCYVDLTLIDNGPYWNLLKTI